MASAVAVAKAGKRPLRSLTAHEKLTAIRRVHEGESKASVARDIGVPESTLRGWCKNEEKISYLSRQSSPDSDESSGDNPIVKRPRTDDIQPYNLSLKGNVEVDIIKKQPMANEHDSSRSKLAKLSAEMGLNRPEVFASTAGSVASGNFNSKSPSELVGLFLQWNNVYQQTLFLQQKLQQKNNKITASSDLTKGLLTTVDKASSASNAAEQLLSYDLAAYWLQQQQRLNAVSTTNTSTVSNTTTSTTAATVAEQQRWWANYYKKMFANLPLQNSNNVHHTHTTHNNTTTTSSSVPTMTTSVSSSTHNTVTTVEKPEKPILYQQLTKAEVAAANGSGMIPNKDQEASENLTTAEETAKPKAVKGRSVLDNILLNNNTIKTDGKNRQQEGEILSQQEALEHGQKFLRWLETCGDPSVTAVQILTLQSLIKNLKAERKNGEVHSKAKVKRK